jgi:hypothetical protein
LGDLDAVTCTSSSNCWTVGSGSHGANAALQWTGRKWIRAATPYGQPGGAGKNRGSSFSLNSVACGSSRNCWAVGGLAGENPYESEVIRWNGRRWTKAAEQKAATDIFGISCPVGSSCWAVGTQNGRDYIVHWKGRKWIATREASRWRGSLAAVSCTSQTYCWAVGVSLSHRGDRSQLLNWNGRQWSTVVIPSPGDGDGLSGITCLSPRDCWAVGTEDIFGPNARSLNMIVHWNGTRWSSPSTH